MTNRALRKVVRRSALSLALGMCFVSGTAGAQSAAGSIFGRADPGDTVSIENLDTGTSRQITADQEGRFSATQLPTGRYRVTVDGVNREVTVSIGTGTPLNFVTTTSTSGEARTLDRIEVVASGAFNPIDVSSVESTTVFTQEQIQQLPVGRDVTNVALLAPGTVRGDSGFGNLASFGGSSIAENGYYINGFDVTNIRNFTSYAGLPFDAIGQQQVKTGGYGAEYGRSLGGVINIVTNRGTNEWKGGVSVYWTPQFLKEQGEDVLTKDSTDIAPYFVYRSANQSEQLSYNVYAGGPVIKDRLFVFGLLEARNDTSDVFDRDTSYRTKNDSPNGLVKIDWNITDNHIVELTGIYNKETTDRTDYDNQFGLQYTASHGEESSKREFENGGEVYIAKYTGYLTDNFTLSAQYGQLKNTDNYQTPEALPGAECPRVWDSRGPNPGNLVYRGCWNQNQTAIRDPDFGPDTDERKAYRVDAEWRIGDHFLRFGYDKEKFTSGHAGSIFTGAGIYYRFFSADAVGFNIPGVTEVVRTWESRTESGTYDVINTAAYLEDSWQVSDNLLLYGGVRAETFENLNANGDTFVESDQLLAPRLGFSWDVNGDSTLKVFGNAGRYYIPVAANTNIRASAAEYFNESWWTFSTIDPNTSVPELEDLIDGPYINGSTTPPDSRTVAATNLEPMFQDEFILGFQKQLGQHWAVGTRGIFREVKNGMDDYCTHNAFNQWAADNGFDEDFALDGEGVDMASCFIMNPGEAVTLAMDPDNDGTLEEYTVSADYLGLPRYTRKYRALEVFWERAKVDNWYLQGSYTYAKSYGNVEGYVNSTLEQEDAGLTQDFDHAAFEAGAYGPLPNDRRHTLKLFGSYDLSDEWAVSANLIVQSGRPVNCNGFLPLSALDIGDPDEGSLAAYSASSFYCLDQDGTIIDDGDTPDDPEDDLRYRLTNRGDYGRTPWSNTVDVAVRYTPNWARQNLTFQVDVFNLFDSRTVTEYNEQSQVTRTETELDPNFLNDVNYQTPRSFRLTARYKW